LLGLKVNIQKDPKLYALCERAFAREIATTIQAVLKNQRTLSAEQMRVLLSHLTHAVCAHISGSSFAGRVNGEEVYPSLGFSVGEQSDAVYFGCGASFHELVPSILTELEPPQSVHWDGQ
jgi:hypothetical protein